MKKIIFVTALSFLMANTLMAQVYQQRNPVGTTTPTTATLVRPRPTNVIGPRLIDTTYAIYTCQDPSNNDGDLQQTRAELKHIPLTIPSGLYPLPAQVAAPKGGFPISYMFTWINNDQTVGVFIGQGYETSNIFYLEVSMFKNGVLERYIKYNGTIIPPPYDKTNRGNPTTAPCVTGTVSVYKIDPTTKRPVFEFTKTRDFLYFLAH